jgi:formate dehydrogenase iron-sulfur subunit
MSREIVVFGGFAAALAAALFTSTVELWAPARASGLANALAGLDPVARWSALATGLAGLFCSIQIYAVTGRPLWRADRTALRFVATVVLLGSAVAAFCGSVGAMFGAGPRSATLALAPLAVLLGMVAAKLAWERGRLVHGMAGHDEVALARTRLLLDDALAAMAGLRRRSGVVCGLGLPVVILAFALRVDDALMQSGAILLCVLGCLAGEIVERDLFFRSEAMRGMPGSA